MAEGNNPPACGSEDKRRSGCFMRNGAMFSKILTQVATRSAMPIRRLSFVSKTIPSKFSFIRNGIRYVPVEIGFVFRATASRLY
jgi:hypothetical protein